MGKRRRECPARSSPMGGQHFEALPPCSISLARIMACTGSKAAHSKQPVATTTVRPAVLPRQFRAQDYGKCYRSWVWPSARARGFAAWSEGGKKYKSSISGQTLRRHPRPPPHLLPPLPQMALGPYPRGYCAATCGRCASSPAQAQRRQVLAKTLGRHFRCTARLPS